MVSAGDPGICNRNTACSFEVFRRPSASLADLPCLTRSRGFLALSLLPCVRSRFSVESVVLGLLLNPVRRCLWSVPHLCRWHWRKAAVQRPRTLQRDAFLGTCSVLISLPIEAGFLSTSRGRACLSYLRKGGNCREKVHSERLLSLHLPLSGLGQALVRALSCWECKYRPGLRLSIPEPQDLTGLVSETLMPRPHAQETLCASDSLLTQLLPAQSSGFRVWGFPKS